MRVDLFDYELPKDRIAQRPASPRDSSRLMVLDRRTGQTAHRRFSDIVDYLRPGDALVVNNTKVLAARLYGKRVRTGRKWEGLVLREIHGGWQVLSQTTGRLAAGERIQLDSDDGQQLELVGRSPESGWIVRPVPDAPLARVLARSGHMPLPPYIRHGRDEPGDRSDYQTVFASNDGAIAAPTAGLHFTPELLQRVRGLGVAVEEVTLHVGPGTFMPVRASETTEHKMHVEWRRLPAPVAERLEQARSRGGRIIAVGTTSVRVLESSWRAGGRFTPTTGETDLFIAPPQTIGSIDGLITNFHLPKSTLLMLVCAFAGIELVLAAYKEAVKEGYRFYSYGDAMFIA